MHCNNDSPESLSPIRSFLIDSGACEPCVRLAVQNYFNAGACSLRTSVTHNAKRFAQKKLSPKRACGERQSRRKSLFHRTLCNFIETRANFCRVLHACGIRRVSVSKDRVTACRKCLMCTVCQAVTFFFSLCCSKPDVSACRFATRADATPAMIHG